MNTPACAKAGSPTTPSALSGVENSGEAGWLWSYHAGFEGADIDYLSLPVRSGPCETDA